MMFLLAGFTDLESSHSTCIILILYSGVNGSLGGVLWRAEIQRINPYIQLWNILSIGLELV